MRSAIAEADSEAPKPLFPRSPQDLLVSHEPMGEKQPEPKTEEQCDEDYLNQEYGN